MEGLGKTGDAQGFILSMEIIAQDVQGYRGIQGCGTQIIIGNCPVDFLKRIAVDLLNFAVAECAVIQVNFIHDAVVIFNRTRQISPQVKRLGVLCQTWDAGIVFADLAAVAEYFHQTGIKAPGDEIPLI